jgi:hypothetical protein
MILGLFYYRHDHLALLQEIIKRRGERSGIKHLRISITAYSHLKTLLAL